MPNYITENRTLIEAVKALSKKRGIEYKLFSGSWILKLQKGSKCHFIYIYDFDINSQASSSIASDKVATFELLNDAGVRSIPHHLLSNVVNPEVTDSDLEEYFRKYKSLVIKPTRGSRGELVAKTNDIDSSLSHIKDNHVNSWAASPYINIQHEMRLIIFRGRVVLVYEKVNPVIINGLKMFNLNLGAKAKNIKIENIDADIPSLAKQAMTAIGLELGAVDVVLDENETPHVLEINSGFSLEHYALNSSVNRTSVISLYESTINSLFED